MPSPVFRGPQPGIPDQQQPGSLLETQSQPLHKHRIINSCLSKSLSPESSPRTQWAPAADHLLEEDGLPRTSDTTGFT